MILKNPLKMKQLAKRLIQMAEEGAVGILQFEMTMARLKDEYGVEAVHQLASSQNKGSIIENFEQRRRNIASVFF